MIHNAREHNGSGRIIPLLPDSAESRLFSVTVVLSVSFYESGGNEQGIPLPAHLLQFNAVSADFGTVVPLGIRVPVDAYARRTCPID